MDPVVNDAYRLRKLLEKATGLKVYKSELIANYFNGYLSIVQEYKRKMVPITTPSFGLTVLMYKSGQNKKRNAGMNGHHRQRKRVMNISIARTKIGISFL